MPSRSIPVVALLLAALALSSMPAAAHVGPEPTIQPLSRDALATATWRAADPAAGVPWVAVLAMLGVMLAGARCPRRAVALGVVLILSVFAFENGVHSVHHLNDRVAGAACAVASATVHVSGTTVEECASLPMMPSSPERLGVDHQPSVDAQSLAVRHGRAPPLPA